MIVVLGIIYMSLKSEELQNWVCVESSLKSEERIVAKGLSSFKSEEQFF